MHMSLEDNAQKLSIKHKRSCPRENVLVSSYKALRLERTKMRIKTVFLFALPYLASALPDQRPKDQNEGNGHDVGEHGHVRAFFYQGHDLSSLKTLEDTGSIFKDTARHNQTRTADAILADGGMNSVRLRLWVNPAYGTNGLDQTLVMAERFQKAGYRIYLDFHFSQVIPSDRVHLFIHRPNTVKGLLRGPQ